MTGRLTNERKKPNRWSRRIGITDGLGYLARTRRTAKIAWSHGTGYPLNRIHQPRRTSRPASITSMPIPSPGIAAIL